MEGDRATTNLEMADPVGKQGATAIWKLEIFWWLEGDRATTAMETRTFFGGRPNLEGDRATTAIWEPEILVVGPVGRRQVYNCNLGTRAFCAQAQLENDRATTAIWELETFWWQVQLEGDRARTPIWELEIFFWVAGPVGTLFFLDRQSLGALAAPAYKNKNVRELLFICGLGHFNRDVGPDFSWRRALEHFLSVALLHVYSLYRNECGCFHVRRAAV